MTATGRHPPDPTNGAAQVPRRENLDRPGNYFSESAYRITQLRIAYQTFPRLAIRHLSVVHAKPDNELMRDVAARATNLATSFEALYTHPEKAIDPRLLDALGVQAQLLASRALAATA